MNYKNFTSQTILVILIAVAFILCTSCGRRTDDCRTRETARLECQVVNTPTYGRPYAQEMCNRNYSAERCY